MLARLISAAVVVALLAGPAAAEGPVEGADITTSLNPALDDLCARTPAEAALPAVRDTAQRTYAIRWDETSRAFVREAENGRMTLSIDGEGCKIRFEATGSAINLLGKLLFNRANVRKLEWTSRDASWPENGADRFRASRGNDAQGRLNWSGLIRPGAGRSSAMDIVWKRPDS